LKTSYFDFGGELRTKMRPLLTLLTLLAVALCGVGVTACGDAGPAPGKRSGSASRVSSTGTATGGAQTPRPSATTQASSPVKSDNDNDGDGGGDDLNWGHAASAADRRAVTALVRRYYTLADMGDGAAACSLIYSIFAEEVPEVYGEGSGEPGLRGKTCAVVVSKLFRLRRGQLSVDVASLDVRRVRVKELRGLAILSFRNMPERDIPVHREHRVWKIEALIDSGLG
jgi:hypothetical protein